MIRDAMELDLPRLAELASAYSEEAGKHSNFPFDLELAIKNVAMSMMSDDTCIKVIVKEGKVVGFIWATLSCLPWSYSKIVFDNILYISPKHRGSSLVVSLIKEYEKWARRLGAVEVSLSIASGINESRTVALYNKLGYKLIGYQCRKELINHG